MNGRISENLEKILRDPEGSQQLRHFLVSGEDTVVHINDAAYVVSSRRPVTDKDHTVSPQKRE